MRRVFVDEYQDVDKDQYDLLKKQTETREAELTQARDRLGALHPTAAPHLDRLFQVVGGLGACIVLADPDGVVIDRRGNAGEDADFRGAGLWTGTTWSESRAGTNGIGTVLAELDQLIEGAQA